MSRTLSYCLGFACLALASDPSTALATPTWWFQDPNFCGDRNVGWYVALGGQPGYTWYDDDVPWPTGSVVRLPEDAHYLGDVLTCVACYGGGTATMHSPYFVGASGKVYFINHMETIYLSGPGWYNGGAVIGLTGGGTCSTGYGTFCNSGSVVSTGPHFCIETANQHSWIDFPITANGCASGSYTPTSSCAYSNGTSGMANVLCSGSSCSPYSGCGQYWWTCGSDGNLHSCDSSGTAVTQNCNGAGCKTNPACTNDVCNNQCTAYTACNQYWWTCGSDGNLHSCNSTGNVVTQTCNGGGCVTTPICNNDYCKCAGYACGTTQYWNCQLDGNLHKCDSAGNQIVTNCNGLGCHVNPPCTDDVCNVPAACKPYACGATYYWSCEADGNLHKCDSSSNPITQTCPYGCQYNGVCVDDSCKSEPPDAGSAPGPDASAPGPDAGSGAADASTKRDAGTEPPDASAPGTDAGQSASGPDASTGEPGDGSDLKPIANGGCGCSAGATGAFELALLAFAPIVSRRRRR